MNVVDPYSCIKFQRKIMFVICFEKSISTALTKFIELGCATCNPSIEQFHSNKLVLMEVAI